MWEVRVIWGLWSQSSGIPNGIVACHCVFVLWLLQWQHQCRSVTFACSSEALLPPLVHLGPVQRWKQNHHGLLTPSALRFDGTDFFLKENWFEEVLWFLPVSLLSLPLPSSAFSISSTCRFPNQCPSSTITFILAVCPPSAPPSLPSPPLLWILQSGGFYPALFWRFPLWLSWAGLLFPRSHASFLSCLSPQFLERTF